MVRHAQETSTHICHPDTDKQRQQYRRENHAPIQLFNWSMRSETKAPAEPGWRKMRFVTTSWLVVFMGGVQWALRSNAPRRSMNSDDIGIICATKIAASTLRRCTAATTSLNCVVSNTEWGTRELGYRQSDGRARKRGENSRPSVRPE